MLPFRKQRSQPHHSNFCQKRMISILIATGFMVEISFGDLLLYLYSNLHLSCVSVHSFERLLRNLYQTSTAFSAARVAIYFRNPSFNLSHVRSQEWGLPRGSQRGSRLVRTFAPMIMMNKDKDLIFGVRTSLIGFLTIQMNGSSFDII